MSEIPSAICPACNARVDADGGHARDCKLLNFVAKRIGDDDYAVDEDARLSLGDVGVWVQVWTYVENEEWQGEDETNNKDGHKRWSGYELHSLLCMNCASDLCDQCLDPNCTEDNDHKADDKACLECQMGEGPNA